MRAILLFAALSSCATQPKETKVIVSVKKQEASIVDAKTYRPIKKFIVSTGAGGVGSKPNSKQTPLGNFRIIKKVGEGYPITVGIKGDTVIPSTKGNDPIVSRSLWIDGLDPWNRNTLNRTVRLHGTPHTDTMGMAVSFGCVRFYPQDIATLCNYVEVGTLVEIK